MSFMLYRVPCQIKKKGLRAEFPKRGLPKKHQM